MGNLGKTESFSNGHLWRCLNLASGESHDVDGPLAEILTRYPGDYALEYIGAKTPAFDAPAVKLEIAHACGSVFLPEKTADLPAAPEYKKRFKNQKLLMGNCYRCHIAVFAWVGVNHVGVPVEYFAIRDKQRDHWIERMLTEQRRQVVKIDPDKHSNYRVGTVTGSVKDRASDHYRYKEVIRVE